MSTDKESIVPLVRRFGGSSTDAIVDTSTLIFTTPDVEGLIGYRNELNCFVVYGDPICSPNDIPALVTAFHEYSKTQHKHIIYVSVSQSFVKWAMQHHCKAFIEFGEELIYNPQIDPAEQKGHHGQLVRQKIHQATHEGVIVQEYVRGSNNDPHLDPNLEQSLEAVAHAWLKNRKGPQVHIAHIRLFKECLGKRWLYAKQGNEIVGIFVLAQLQSRKGWLLTDLMVTPQAPHGTQELLVTTALQILRSEGCTYTTSGSAPKVPLGQVHGFNKFTTWSIKKAYQIATWMFRLRGHKMFWSKFSPQSEPTHLLFSNPSISIPDLISLMRSLNVSLTLRKMIGISTEPKPRG